MAHSEKIRLYDWLPKPGLKCRGSVFLQWQLPVCKLHHLMQTIKVIIIIIIEGHLAVTFQWIKTLTLIQNAYLLYDISCRALNTNRNCIEAQRMVVMYTLCREGKYSEVNIKTKCCFVAMCMRVKRDPFKCLEVHHKLGCNYCFDFCNVAAMTWFAVSLLNT